MGGSVDMKRCACCAQEKCLNLFGKDKGRKDGKNPYCLECVRGKSLAYSAANREKRRATVRASDARCRPRAIKWRSENAGRLAEYWRAYNAEYRKANHELMRKKSRDAQAARRRATPPWFDKAACEAIYRKAAAMRADGDRVEVDHIVPLKSPLVCGLHWHGNLRIVPVKVNKAKRNLLIEELALSPIA